MALEFPTYETGVPTGVALRSNGLLALCREVRDKMNVGTYSAMPYVPTFIP